MGRSTRLCHALAAAVPAPLLLAALLALLIPASAAAQIVINEIYPDPAGTDDPLERVEIYNAGATPIDVTGWGIHDAASIDGSPALRCRIPEDFDTALCPGSAIIQPGEFRVVKATVVAAWLNQGGDDIYLCSNRTIPATIVHQVTYPTASGHVDEVWAALPNGTSGFAWRAKTLCASNGGVGDVTAPNAVSDLVAVPGGAPGEIRLTWTAPGDDGATGTATAYVMKVATASINSGNFDAATDMEFWINEPLPRVPGTPETLFVFGLNPSTTYHFALKTQDEIPNTSAVSNSPSSAPFAGLLLDPDLGHSAYFGNLHSHTGYSDGVLTPAAAYNFARNTAPTPLDFLAVTDHNHSSAGMSLPSYAQGMSEAAAANDDGDFVAIYGQEWGLAVNGHVNIFESPALFGWEGGNHDVFVAEGDYAALYTAMLANPPAAYPAIAEWCHPAIGDFDNFQVTNDGRSVVHLMALVNGPATSTATDESDIGNTGFDDEFVQALRVGYRVSPTADQDNHNATWGASSESRTAVLAFTRTKSAILNGMAARRTYATQDHNAVVHFSADGQPMGGAFARGQGVRIAVEVTDPDLGESVAQIDLFRGFTGLSNATLVAWNTGNNAFQWRERQSFTPGAEAHYYLRIRMADNQNIWTGPVYVTYDPAITTGVDDPAAPDLAMSLSASPNPAPGSTSVEFVVPARDHGSLAVYDLTGRVVRTLHDGELDAGPHRTTWDGLTDDGTRVRTGLYFLRLATRAGVVTRRITLLQ